LAESTWDGPAFAAALGTRALGRTLVVRGETTSTNDLAWDGVSQGLPDGATYVADLQTRGRGRAGRSWWAPPGQGLLLSVVVRPGCAPDALGLLPLVVGLAAADALERCGIGVQLKWPNDLLIEGRKLGGVLCEVRGLESGEPVAVIGLGVNVGQAPEDFPPELRERAASLRGSGVVVTRERLAAAFLNALEPLLEDYRERGGAGRVRDRYRARAAFWGEPVSLHGPGGTLVGTARDLDASGGLVVRLPDGREVVAMAGDLEPAAEADA
jgi:BirA family biotin operon repressor/biotin-[acetyl-CoA-carboxylase] ligase